jgi:hypothetical protein
VVTEAGTASEAAEEVGVRLVDAAGGGAVNISALLGGRKISEARAGEWRAPAVKTELHSLQRKGVFIFPSFL